MQEIHIVPASSPPAWGTFCLTSSSNVFYSEQTMSLPLKNFQGGPQKVWEKEPLKIALVTPPEYSYASMYAPKHPHLKSLPGPLDSLCTH